jgi:uncharacterized membrane protein
MIALPARDELLSGAVAALELAAALVILWAAAAALVGYASRKLRRPAGPTEDVRQRFGSSLLLALDFAIGSDVLKVAIVPTFEAAGTIGITVLVRVVLTFVLERELRHAPAPEERP